MLSVVACWLGDVISCGVVCLSAVCCLSACLTPTSTTTRMAREWHENGTVCSRFFLSCSDAQLVAQLVAIPKTRSYARSWRRMWLALADVARTLRSDVESTIAGTVSQLVASRARKIVSEAVAQLVAIPATRRCFAEEWSTLAGSGRPSRRHIPVVCSRGGF